jgi:ornithine cyclodeaminase
MKGASFSCHPIATIEDKIAAVDIISCATLSKAPLVLGRYLSPGQHVDLVGAYKKDMREADDAAIKRASVFVDTPAGINESGDMYIPLQSGILKKEEIKGDLFSLCSGRASGRTNGNEVTLFKSVGHALEDLVAATYYYDKFTNE